MRLTTTTLTLSQIVFATAAILPATRTTTSSTTSHSSTNTPLPLIIWHGLGDRYDADGLASVAELANTIHPNTTVYPIRLSEDGSLDSRYTFFGNITEYIAQVCANITSNPLLSANNTRVDALGFSQGGQFLRGLIQRCPGVQVRSLVTFGSQHNGIAKFQNCGTWDFVCKGAMAAMKGNAWSEWVQNNIIPAQYYREVNETTGLGSEDYLNRSNFLADVNNERESKSKVYKERLTKLERFAMYVFEDDTTVIPKESGWFADVNATDGEVTPLHKRKMYKEDWLGLKELDERSALVFRNATGGHMRLTDKVLKEAFTDFFGPERKSWAGDDVSQEETLREGLPQQVFAEL